MYVNNPYAQAGWHNPENPFSINDGPWHPNALHAPTFGALPSPTNCPQSILTFEFRFGSKIGQDVLNCTVFGPRQLKFFDIQTNSFGRTIISKSGNPFAAIQWSQTQNNCTVEAKGVVALQRVGQFLVLSQDQRVRSMFICGKSYTWVPRQSGIYLYSSGPSAPEEYARASIAQDMTGVLLEITSEAFQAGLFEPCVIATTLLFGGRRFD
ncbi:hypothetical protein GALMADRAFT_144731 [Galerina marginata CBS 339.88]|uniref:Uncharacterized protein n=1 Tax=Galerina marginata (strain CBS 339.88) TaxID=685588 RepID=A0A067SHT8_GALM3|nr:hypothetical protein GALMADRAFT_144731 [Galerina marginata CBS 339.88]